MLRAAEHVLTHAVIDGLLVCHAISTLYSSQWHAAAQIVISFLCLAQATLLLVGGGLARYASASSDLWDGAVAVQQVALALVVDRRLYRRSGQGLHLVLLLPVCRIMTIRASCCRNMTVSGLLSRLGLV